MALKETNLPAGQSHIMLGQGVKGRMVEALEATASNGTCSEKANTTPDPSTAFAKSAETTITEHYLTFDTPLPVPSTFEINGSRGPDMPDLKDCVSPFTWSEPRKTFTTWLSCASTIIAAYTPGSYGPPSVQMMEYFGVSEVVILLGITTFTSGFAIAPMVLAPFSELNGRKPMFIVSGVLFFVCQLSCGLTTSYPGMLLARFFGGVGSSTFSTMVGGIISDMYHPKDRNTAMALFSGAVLFATGLGPLCSAFITQHLGWRWVFFVQTITCAVVVAIVTIFFKESRGDVLLSQKAKRLNKWMEVREKAGLTGFEMPVEGEGRTMSQRIRWKVESDEERESLGRMIGISLYRPFHLLCTEPVVFFFSLWVAFAWAVLFLTFASVPLVFTVNYGFNVEQNGGVFASMCVGAVLATILSIYQEKVARHCGMMFESPEGRLYFTCFESALMPIGLFWFGWTSFPHIHWILPTMAIGCATMGIFSIYLAAFNYLADTYQRYSSSALAAQSFCRNMLGGLFPLVTDDLFLNLGFPLASTLVGGISALLTIVPWVLVFYGKNIRARSKFASKSAAESSRK